VALLEGAAVGRHLTEFPTSKGPAHGDVRSNRLTSCWEPGSPYGSGPSTGKDPAEDDTHDKQSRPAPSAGTLDRHDGNGSSDGSGAGDRKEDAVATVAEGEDRRGDAGGEGKRECKETVLVLSAWAVAGAVVTPLVLRRMSRRSTGSRVQAAREAAVQWVR